MCRHALRPNTRILLVFVILVIVSVLRSDRIPPLVEMLSTVILLFDLTWLCLPPKDRNLESRRGLSVLSSANRDQPLDNEPPHHPLMKIDEVEF